MKLSHRGTTASTAQEILETVAEHQAQLRRLGVRTLGLFGSYSRGEPGPKSDLDFLVVMERPSFRGYMEVKFLLEDLFSRRVDLVLEESLKPRLRSRVLAEVGVCPGTIASSDTE